ncbi:MAG TPA: pitrilysin family protein, partial [Polyangiaceae bacterium]|nr:pitrilysin family protein [Polyangiaceae bacterium]
MTEPRGIAALEPRVCELGNGLALAAVSLPALHRAVITAEIRIGSVYESSAQNGISHFLEHMLFRGTPAHPTAHRLAARFEALGGTLEASTSEEFGTLSISLPPESVEAALGTFCEVLSEPLLTDLDAERDIVREELLEGLDEKGRDIDASSRCRRLCFGDHPLGFPIAGTLTALDTWDHPTLQRHHARHYTGRNLAVVVSGPVAVESVLASASRRLETIPAGSVVESAVPEPQTAARFGFLNHKASQTALSVCYRAHERASVHQAPTEMLLRILDDGLSTRVYHRLCDQLGLCYDAGAGYQAFDTAGIIEFDGETAHERAPLLLREILDLAEALASSGPTEAELEQARRRCQWQFEAMLDDPESVAHFYAHSLLGRNQQSPLDRYRELCDVSRQAVLDAAQSAFQQSRLSVAAVGIQRGKALDALESLVLS